MLSLCNFSIIAFSFLSAFKLRSICLEMDSCLTRYKTLNGTYYFHNDYPLEFAIAKQKCQESATSLAVFDSRERFDDVVAHIPRNSSRCSSSFYIIGLSRINSDFYSWTDRSIYHEELGAIRENPGTSACRSVMVYSAKRKTKPELFSFPCEQAGTFICFGDNEDRSVTEQSTSAFATTNDVLISSQNFTTASSFTPTQSIKIKDVPVSSQSFTTARSFISTQSMQIKDPLHVGLFVGLPLALFVLLIVIGVGICWKKKIRSSSSNLIPLQVNSLRSSSAGLIEESVYLRIKIQDTVTLKDLESQQVVQTV